MAYRDIRIIGDPVLRMQCEWITDIDDSVKALVEDLLETVDDEVSHSLQIRMSV